MLLVGYSESEGSDTEQGPALPDKKIASKSSKKLVDASNKIRVNLPTARIEDEVDERPAKKARTGGGAGLLGDLNALLPAPKRSGAATADQEMGKSNREKISMGKGRPLGSGVSLKTGATPAFSREALEGESMDAHGNDGDQQMDDAEKEPVSIEQVKLIGKATVFRPLSVANKKKKRPMARPIATSSIATSSSNPQVAAPAEALSKAKPTVSLFSIALSAGPDLPPEPELEPTDLTPLPEDDSYSLPEAGPTLGSDHTPTFSSTSQPRTLSDLANSLNLPAASRRQLLGRQAAHGDMPINLLNFDTDIQYAENEKLRASGETVQHNPLRSIQPGRHTLRQLVSAATSQKEALEEKWAEGKAKQGEAGGRYGWR
jgi:hypothetical protein